MLGGKTEKHFEGLSKLNIIFIFTLLSENKYIFFWIIVKIHSSFDSDIPVPAIC